MYKNRLKLLRERLNITQNSLAQNLKIERSCYGHYENEDDIIPIKHLNNICNYFNVSLDYIFEFTDTTQYKNNKKEIDLIKMGSHLKEFRKEKKLTQKKLAEKLNIANTMLSEYEKGHYLISTATLYGICKNYHISADYLLGKIESPIHK